MAALTATTSNYDQYIMNPSTTIKSMRHGLRACTILTYTDGSEWVVTNNPQKERFCGFLYLQDALKESDKVKPAANKMAMHDRTIIYLSEYAGDEKPDFFMRLNEINVIAETGFSDMPHEANLREKDGKVFVFDTEPSSFKLWALKHVGTYKPQHDEILAHLKATYEAHDNGKGS